MFAKLYTTGIAILFVLTACGDNQPEVVPLDITLANGSLVSAPFGSNDDRCASARLTNDVGDEKLLLAAVDCLFSEIDLGNAVVVDIDRPTVEGDSTFTRFHFDGETVLLVEDDRLDTFGRGGVSAQRCQSLTRTQGLPEGVACDRASHPGFPEATN